MGVVEEVIPVAVFCGAYDRLSETLRVHGLVDADEHEGVEVEASESWRFGGIGDCDKLDRHLEDKF